MKLVRSRWRVRSQRSLRLWMTTEMSKKKVSKWKERSAKSAVSKNCLQKRKSDENSSTNLSPREITTCVILSRSIRLSRRLKTKF